MSCVLLVPSASFSKFHQQDRSEHIWDFVPFIMIDGVLTERLTNQVFFSSSTRDKRWPEQKMKPLRAVVRHLLSGVTQPTNTERFHFLSIYLYTRQSCAAAIATSDRHHPWWCYHSRKPPQHFILINNKGFDRTTFHTLPHSVGSTRREISR
jgi:hypothetical protein